MARELGGRRTEHRAVDPRLDFDKYKKQGNNWFPIPRSRRPIFTSRQRRRSRHRVHAVRCEWQPDVRIWSSVDAQGGQCPEPPLVGLVPGARSSQRGRQSELGRRRLPQQHRNCNATSSDRRHDPDRKGQHGRADGQGVGDLVAKDPGATWNTSTKTVQGSCAPGVCPDGQYTPEARESCPWPCSTSTSSSRDRPPARQP